MADQDSSKSVEKGADDVNDSVDGAKKVSSDAQDYVSNAESESEKVFDDGVGLSVQEVNDTANSTNMTIGEKISSAAERFQL